MIGTNDRIKRMVMIGNCVFGCVGNQVNQLGSTNHASKEGF